jgi:hypothetical protein
MAVGKRHWPCKWPLLLVYKSLFWFIPVDIAQKALDARGNGTGTPIGGDALNSGTTFSTTHGYSIACTILIIHQN